MTLDTNPKRKRSMKTTRRFWIPAAVILAALSLGDYDGAKAEYGDVVINEYSDEAGMRPVIFPHWFHRIRFRCKVCHGDLGFKFEAGGNDINMLKIIDGEYCGACHNGSVAWSIENCDLCHSGIPNTPTQVHHSTVQKLVAPVRAPVPNAPADSPAQDPEESE